MIATLLIHDHLMDGSCYNSLLEYEFAEKKGITLYVAMNT